MKNVSQCNYGGWAGQHGKNRNVAIFSDNINVINVKLCMILLLIELYPFVPLSVTLAIFQGQMKKGNVVKVKQFLNKNLVLLCLS